MSEEDTEEWDKAVYPCLAADTAHGLFYTLMVVGFGEFGGEFGIEGLAEEEKACLREWVAGQDLAALIDEDPEGDFIVEAFGCFPNVVIDLLGLGFTLALGEEWKVSEEERACLREWFADEDLAALMGDPDDNPAAAAAYSQLMGCIPSLFIAAIAAETGMPAPELGEEERTCLRGWADGVDWPTVSASLDSDDDLWTSSSAFSGLFGCVPDLFLQILLAEGGTSLEGLSEGERSCFRAWADKVDWADFFTTVLADGDDLPEIARFVPELAACAPHVFVERAEAAPTTPATGGVGSDWASVSAGDAHACGMKTDGSVACWGGEEWGRATPPAGSFGSVSAGALHTCGLKADGTVVCWGDSELGQTTAPNGSFASLDAGRAHTCGVKPDGSVECWGLDNHGQATPPEGSFTSVNAG